MSTRWVPFRRSTLSIMIFAVVACSPDAIVPLRSPDVLVISVDCMRADHVGAYGYDRDTTPAIDSIARDGIFFDRAYAQANWTKPSVASLMTGLYVRNHGVVVGTDYFDAEGVHKVGANSFPLPDDIPLMSEAFRSAGYRTVGFIENSHLIPAQGFGRGFDTYEKAKPAARYLEDWLVELSPQESFHSETAGFEGLKRKTPFMGVFLANDKEGKTLEKIKEPTRAILKGRIPCIL